jgi:hypothetical protein
MSDLSSAGKDKPGSSKKKVSPLRNGIGLVVLATVIVCGWLQYSAKSGYSAAVAALNDRMQQEDKDLLSEQEADSLFGKSPDGPGSDFREANRSFTKKTYTWRGLLKSYTLTAFYTKAINPALHHFETEGAKLAPESNSAATVPNTINDPVFPAANAATAEPSKPAPTKAAGPKIAKTPEPTAEASKSSGSKDAVTEKAPK